MSKTLPKTLFLAIILSLALILPCVTAKPGQYTYSYVWKFVNGTKPKNVTLPFLTDKSFNYTVQLTYHEPDENNFVKLIFGQNYTGINTGPNYRYNIEVQPVNAMSVLYRANEGDMEEESLASVPMTGTYTNETHAWTVTIPEDAGDGDDTPMVPTFFVYVESDSAIYTHPGGYMQVQLWINCPEATATEKTAYMVWAVMPVMLLAMLLKKFRK